MAAQGLRVKVLGIKSQADDFLGQFTEGSVTEAGNLNSFKVFIDDTWIF